VGAARVELRRMRPHLLATFALVFGLSCTPRPDTSIGAQAPEIAAKDLDGVAFQLSDYRGKVVLLDFWGDWCPRCQAMYPHGRSLAERYADAPFAIVGVNGDPDQKQLAAVRAAQEISWRSFWDGPAGRPGPIAEAWDVRAWPTLFLIDAKGVIRAKFIGGNEGAIDTAIGELLAELE